MIKISVVSYNNEVSAEPLSAVFGPDSATIGRGNDNFLVLPDPKRYVSRLQASVKSDGARHSIANLSQANPILVNGLEIALGQDVELHHGDEIQIGLYLLRAESPVATAPPARNEIAPLASVAAPSGATAIKESSAASAGFDLSSPGAAGADPFADLLGGAVNIHAPAPSTAAVPAKPAPIARQTSPSAAPDPLGFDDLLGLSSAPAGAKLPTAGLPAKTDPFGFDDLLEPSSAPTSVKPAAASASPADAFGFDDLLSGPTHTPLLPEQNATIIPEDFDPFAMPSNAARNSGDPLAGLSNPGVSLESIADRNVTIDGLISASGAPERSPLDPVALGPTPASETDPLALFASEPILTTKQDDFLGDVASNHVSELKSHFAMPQARQDVAPPALPADAARPTPVPIAPQPVAPAPVLEAAIAPPPARAPSIPTASERPAAPNRSAADTLVLAEAFLRGANLPLDTLPAGVTPEWMEMMGRFVATATEGAVELIASRALVKREVRADLTMIEVRNNNPLKFLPDGHTALLQMLGRKIPGFMGPVEAMQDAYVDLRAHQIGVVAGMRAALDEVLRRFDPAMLEKKLKARTLIDSLIAANRKAKMWDLYAELFNEIFAEAQDDFQTLFGKAFLSAYESEIQRFRQGSKT